MYRAFLSKGRNALTASSAVAIRQQWVTILRYTHPTSGGKTGKNRSIDETDRFYLAFTAAGVFVFTFVW